MQYLTQITVNHHFTGMSPLLDQDLIDAMWHFLEGRLSSYLLSALKHPDATMLVTMDVRKHGDADLYDGKFDFIVNGKEYIYSADAFKNPRDLVSHATQHLKEQLADA
jgi:hypothetical protein